MAVIHNGMWLIGLVEQLRGGENGTVPDRQIEILHADAYQATVLKPAGLSTERPGGGESVISELRASLGREDVQLPHRLDRPACGIVLAALGTDSVAFHNRMAAEKRWLKIYLAALPWPGRPLQLIGRHHLYLRRRGKRADVVRSGGQPASLDVIDVRPSPTDQRVGHALIRLHTGRYHQIRATLAHIGAPLCGDELYGGASGDFFLEHAILGFPACPDESWRVAFDASGSLRPAIAPELAAQLAKIARWSEADAVRHAANSASH